MAGSPSYTVILDANVLYPITLSDTLMSLAAEGLFRARWTPTIEEEVSRNLARKRPDLADKIPTRIAMMRQAIPDCIVENYELIQDGLNLPDPKDKHVLAAAIIGHADAIVTFNLKDFPEDELQKYNVEPIHPDDFLINQFQLDQVKALSAIKAMRERWKRPEFTPEQLIQLFEANELSQTAAYLTSAVSLI